MNCDLATECEHTDRPRFGLLGTCKPCFYQHPSRARASACDHSDRPVFARGLCRSCYSGFARRNPARPRASECPHAWRASYAKGFCQACDHLRRKYKLTGEALRTVVAAKACDICSTSLATDRHVDHCHTTGRVRGVLCGGCNRGLGCFKDSTLALRAAVRYLRKAVR